MKCGRSAHIATQQAIMLAAATLCTWRIPHSQCLSSVVHCCVFTMCAADAGANTSVLDNDGCSLLDHACRTGDWGWVKWALQAGCQLPAKGVKGLVKTLQASKLGNQSVSKAVGCSMSGASLFAPASTRVASDMLAWWYACCPMLLKRDAQRSTVHKLLLLVPSSRYTQCFVPLASHVDSHLSRHHSRHVI
jgi:hypothetical protein